jgi:hypothetical protein
VRAALAFFGGASVFASGAATASRQFDFSSHFLPGFRSLGAHGLRARPAPNDIAQFLDCFFGFHVLTLFNKRTSVRI